MPTLGNSRRQLVLYTSYKIVPHIPPIKCPFFLSIEHISKPRISVQPYSSTVVYGQPLCLFVDVENPDSSTKFQWYQSNELINGRESRELLIHSVIDSDGGDYYCRVTNCAGSTDSQVARVSISNGQGPLVRAPDRWGQYGRMGYRGRGEPEDEDEPCGQPVPSSAPPTSANASTTQASASRKLLWYSIWKPHGKQYLYM